ncbi:unnamed protein product [Arctogadus glacialis]
MMLKLHISKQELFFLKRLALCSRPCGLLRLVSRSTRIFDQGPGSHHTFYKSCAAEMLRTVMEQDCVTPLPRRSTTTLETRFRVKLMLPEWYNPMSQICRLPSLEECICIHLKSNVEKFYLLCMMTRKLFTFAKQECTDENLDSLMTQRSSHLGSCAYASSRSGWPAG